MTELVTDEELLRRGAARLTEAGIGEPEEDAARLLHRARALGAQDTVAEVFDRLVAERARHVPMGYLAGTDTFMGHELAVDPRVQITRPVMRTVVEVCAELVRGLAGAQPFPVVDVGTGNGALAIALARLAPAARPIYATDLSADALEVARLNVERAELAGHVVLREGHLLEPVPEPVGLVLANLPFVSAAMRGLLEPGVEENEPATAVFGAGESGWGLQHELLEQAGRRDVPPEAVVVTFHISQEREARAAAAGHLPGYEISVRELRPGWSGVLVATRPRG
ncbi:methyltransferase [Amycolatopsis sp. A133]|uniref:methyltransferase n=1 Tax=Amycolatopsis sp. A133 TaxID=3064472 RepID=UPI0027E9379A|nr:methyltransferase [Amycolatopsis sp. A133]MDQ7803455.1 methyltransferase [Amycolatopsis sp. A133]